MNDNYYVLNAESWDVTGLKLERLLLALAATIGLKAREAVGPVVKWSR